MTSTTDQSGLVVKRGGTFIAVAVVQSIASALFLPVLTRTLDPEQLGVVAAVQAVTLLTVIVVSLGLATAVTREFFHDDGPARSSRVMGLLVVIAPLLVGVVHVAGPWWSRLLDGIGYNAVLQIAVWTALPRAIIFAGMARLRAELRSVSFGIIGLATAVGSQGVGLLLLLQEPDVVRYVAGLGITQLVLVIVVLAMIRPRFDGIASLAPQTLRYTTPVAVHSSAGIVVTVGDRFVIGRILGLEEVGRYQIAYAIGSLVILATLAINNAWGPLVLGAPASQQRAILAETTRSFVRLNAAVMVGLAAVAPVALRILAPESYQPRDLVATTMIITVTAVPLVFYLAGNHVAMLERRTLRLASATVLGAVVNVVANLLLIGPLGLEGAALATVLSYVVWAVVLHSSPDARSVNWSLGQVAPAIAGAIGAMALLFLVPDGRYDVVVRVALCTSAAWFVVSEMRRLLVPLGRGSSAAEADSHAESLNALD